MKTYENIKSGMSNTSRRWLVTGAAGFIGSHLLEQLLRLDQHVTGLDNFSTGKRENLDDVRSLVSEQQWQQFNFIEGDICNLDTCRTACKGVDVILHQAALGSVPRSIDDPIICNENNVCGNLNMLKAACDTGVKRMVFASSSAVYGDDPGLPKVENICGRQLSPYAVSKMVNELYAQVFSRLYGLETIGLRYFNVFGPRQDPDGAYAAVIPRWISALCSGENVYINGTGETSRDFCYIENVVQANLLAALTKNRNALNQVYNVALNKRITLNELYYMLQNKILTFCRRRKERRPIYRDFRQGDVLHSQADVSKAEQLMGYAPTHSIEDGLEIAVMWYMKKFPPDKPGDTP
jgi:UDP-N-acetylglucosamine 4-epimerase